MADQSSKVCAGGPTLIFACSGAADVGHISDLAARKLMKEGGGQMFCLAGIGGRIDPILQKTRSARRILAIDGCSLDCVKKNLQQAGFEEMIHFRVTDLGLEKGKSPATEENVGKVIVKGKALLD